jgi:peptidoglycan-N-acetylmuramic acid deacetylase
MLKMAQSLGYKTVFWSFAYADWDNGAQMSESAALKKILDNIHNGEIMLLHPTSATNAKIMERLIRELKSLGYRFATLDEM